MFVTFVHSFMGAFRSGGNSSSQLNRNHRNSDSRPEPFMKLTTVDPGVELKFFGSYRTHDLQNRNTTKG